jgi:hypothetical protein
VALSKGFHDSHVDRARRLFSVSWHAGSAYRAQAPITRPGQIDRSAWYRPALGGYRLHRRARSSNGASCDALSLTWMARLQACCKRGSRRFAAQSVKRRRGIIDANPEWGERHLAPAKNYQTPGNILQRT